MSKDLQRLLDRKDNAHYGVIQVALGEEGKMVEWAARLLADARAAVETWRFVGTRSGKGRSVRQYCTQSQLRVSPTASHHAADPAAPPWSVRPV